MVHFASFSFGRGAGEGRVVDIWGTEREQSEALYTWIWAQSDALWIGLAFAEQGRESLKPRTNAEV